MKAWKIAAIAAGGVVAAAGAIFAYDHFLGDKKLTRPYGVVVGKSIREDGAYLLVKRFNKIYEIQVDEATCNTVKKKSLYDLTHYFAAIRNEEFNVDNFSVEALFDAAEETVEEVDAPADTNPEADIIFETEVPTEA